nr:PREDICTED: uncharacterized protein LOC109033388 [Bemisia tabaci]XP_018901529.1 PREDICTED: uncharacterized protein LOC109033388 [Bemisia tabaci]
MRSLSSSEECIFRKGRPNRRNLRDENRSAFSTRTVSRPDKRPKEVETLYLESPKDCRRSLKTSKKRNGKSEESNINQRQNLDKSEEVSPSAKSSYGPTFMATESSVECPPPNFSTASQKLSSETLKAYATALGIKTDQVACEDNRSVGGTNPQKLSAETMLAYQTALGMKADQTNEGGQNLFETSTPKLSTKAFRAYSKTPDICADLEDEKYHDIGYRLVQTNDECKIGNQMESRGLKIFGVSDRKWSTDCFDHCRDHGTAVEKIGGKLVATPSSSDLEDTLRGLNLDEMNEEQLRKLYDYETSSSRNFSSCGVESAHTCEIGRKFKAKPGSNPARKPISSWHGSVDHGSNRHRSPCTVTVKSNINSDFGRSISGVGAHPRTTPKSCGREVKDYGDHISRQPKIESRSFDRGRERFAPEVKRFGACDQETIRPVVQVYERFGPSKANGMQARWEVDSSCPSSTWKRLPPETACHQRCPQSMIGSEVKSLGSINRAGFEPVPSCHRSNRKRPELGMVVNRCDQRSFETGNPKLLQTRPDSAVTKHTNFNQKLFSPEMVSRYVDEKILPKRCDQERFHPEKLSKNFDQKFSDPKMRPRHSNCDQFTTKITEPKHLSGKQLEAPNNGSKHEYRRLSELNLSCHPRLTPLGLESSQRLSLTSPLDNKASMQFCQMLAKSLPDAKIIPFNKLSEILPEAELAKVNEKINSNINAKQVSPCLFDDTQLQIDRIKQQVLRKAKECLPNATFSKINQFLLSSKSESEPELIRTSMSPSESKDAISSSNELQTSGRASSFYQSEASPSRTSPKQSRKLKKCSSYYNYMYPVGNQRRRSGKTTKRTSEIKPKAQTKEESKTSAERRPTNSKAKRQTARSSSSEDTSKG